MFFYGRFLLAVIVVVFRVAPKLSFFLLPLRTYLFYGSNYMHFVYLLQCSDGSLYTGSTNDLERRVKEHNGSKRGARYTKTRRPVVLKYFEKCRTLAKARSREAEIKRMTRGEKIKLFA